MSNSGQTDWNLKKNDWPWSKILVSGHQTYPWLLFWDKAKEISLWSENTYLTLNIAYKYMYLFANIILKETDLLKNIYMKVLYKEFYFEAL